MRATQDIDAKPLPRIAYSQRDGITPDGERNALAAIYKLCLKKSYAKRNAAGAASTNGDDEKVRSRNDSLAKTRIP
jgi:hypothetical protein